MNVITKELERKILAQITTADLTEDGCFVEGKIGLFTNDIVVDKDTVYADLEQPSFEGYDLSATVALGAPFIDEAGCYHVGSDLKQFLCDDGIPNDEIVGAFYFTGAPAAEKVLVIEKFDVPIQISNVGDGLRYAVTLRLGLDGDFGSGMLLA